jgi:DNA-binding transcriptional ArsR family regulator
MEDEEIEQRFALFSRREIREHLGWSISQVRIHLERLREMEYVCTRSGCTGSAFQYELLIDVSEETENIHTGLIDAGKLKVRCKPVGF